MEGSRGRGPTRTVYTTGDRPPPTLWPSPGCALRGAPGNGRASTGRPAPGMPCVQSATMTGSDAPAPDATPINVVLVDDDPTPLPTPQPNPPRAASPSR